jgi:hypothetical protein
MLQTFTDTPQEVFMFDLATVQASDQVSLANVDGALREWATLSNMISGVQTAAAVQEGRGGSFTTTAAQLVFFPLYKRGAYVPLPRSTCRESANSGSLVRTSR